MKASSLLLILLWPALGAAQQAPPKRDPAEISKPRKYQHPPDYANVAYGPHERNVLDVWKAKSDKPTPVLLNIHGGAFVMGDKTMLSPALLEYCLSKGVSVATINYRYSTQAPYPAPMADGARAVQFLRSKAKEWNFNPKAFASMGGSAGAGISMWIGFHDDMADPQSDDPIKRESTRLSVIGSVDGQTSYNPRVVAQIVDEPTSRISALPQLIGRKGEAAKTPEADQLFEDASPVTHLTKDDPPIFMFYTRPMKPLPAADQGEGIHNPRFGYYLKERMDKLGIECVVRTVSDYPEPGQGPGKPNHAQQDMVDFFLKHFPKD